MIVDGGGPGISCVLDAPACAAKALIGGGTSVGGDLVHAAANGVIDVFTSALSSAAIWLLSHIISLVSGPTQIDLTKPWFQQSFALMLKMAAVVVVPLLLIATIGPLLRQDLRRLGRVWGVGLPVALVSGFLATQLAQLGLSATDQLCQVVLSQGLPKNGKGLKAFEIAGAIPGAPQLVVALFSVLLIAGAVLLWLELVLRASAVYIAAFFMPLALVTYVWPSTGAIAKRTIELIVALIISKFVIVATLTLGVAALSGGADDMVVGSAILLLAAFAPFCLLRLAPIVETAAIAHLEGMSRRPVHAASRGALAAATAPSHPVVGLVASARSSGEAPPSRPSPVMAQALAHRPADFLTSDQPEDGAGE